MDDTFMDAEAGPSGTQYATYPANEVTEGAPPLQEGGEDQGIVEDVEESRQAKLEAEAAAAAAEAESAMHAHHMRFHRPFIPPETSIAFKRTSFPPGRAKLASQQAVAPPSFQSRYQLAGHKNYVTSIRFSQDGQWLATAGADGRILLFAITKTSQPSFVRSFTVPPPHPPRFVRTTQANYANGNGPVGSQGINDITFSPDSKCLAIAADDKLARIWKIDAHQQLPDVSFDNEAQHEANGHAINGVNGYGGRPNGHTPSSDDGVKILRGHTSFVFCVAFSPQGNLLASGSYDETIRIWDVKRARCLRTLPAHSDPVSAINFSRDGTLLCSSGHDGLLRLWDASTGQCLKTLVGEANPPASFATFSPNSRYILCSSLDSSIRLWDYHAAQCVKTYAGHKNIKYHIPALFLVTDQGSGAVHIVAGSEDGKIYFWDLQTRQVMSELEAHKEAVLCLAYDHHSGMLASASVDSEYTVTLWSAATPAVAELQLANSTQADNLLPEHSETPPAEDVLEGDTEMNQE